jgi:DNA-binding NarL/FixJ family response regulator
MNMTTTALILEDDDLTRVSVAAALEAANVTVVARAKTSAEALSLARRFLPAVALLDLHLGRGPSGVDVAHQLRKLSPAIGIVFLTTFADPRLVREHRPLPEGSQYLVKRDVAGIDHLLSAISASLRGANRRATPKHVGDISQLSDIQLLTLKLLAQGLSNAEIAHRRQVSEKSVEALIRRLAKALNVSQSEKFNQRVQLARRYFESFGQTVDFE